MEVLMRDNGLNALEREVGGRLLAGQNAGRVEDIQALVFHGAHIEVVHSDDHEDVEIVFATIDFLIPAHGSLEGIHGMLAFGSVPGLNVDAQINIPTGTGFEGILFFDQIACYQGKEVTGFGERIFPSDEVASILKIASLHVVAVGQQHRATGLIRFNTGAVTSHHVRSIRKIGDTAEAFRFTLGTKHTRGFIQTFKTGIVLGFNPGHDR